MTKLKLKTFDDLSNKIKVQKGANKEVIIKANRALRWMMHCAILSDPYPGPLLPPMGRWGKPTKHHFLIYSSRHGLTAVRAYYWRNGNALEHKRRPETFAEVADSLMCMILNEGIDARVLTFFYVYRVNFDQEPQERKKEAQKTDMNSETLRQSTKFLSNSKNRSAMRTCVAYEFNCL